MGARVPALLALVVVAAAGCLEKNPDYCADASLYHYSCARQDAGMDVGSEAATDAADSSFAGTMASFRRAYRERRPSTRSW